MNTWNSVEGSNAPVLQLSPLGVLPEYQGRGHGSALVRASARRRARARRAAPPPRGQPEVLRPLRLRQSRRARPAAAARGAPRLRRSRSPSSIRRPIFRRDESCTRRRLRGSSARAAQRERHRPPGCRTDGSGLLVERHEEARELCRLAGFSAARTAHEALVFGAERTVPAGDVPAEAGSTLGRWRRWRQAKGTSVSSTSCLPRSRGTAAPSTAISSRAPSISPPRRTRDRRAAPARRSSSIPSASRASAPSSASTSRRSPPRCSTTSSRTPPPTSRTSAPSSATR